jgi:hypothetical protein
LPGSEGNKHASSDSSTFGILLSWDCWFEGGGRGEEVKPPIVTAESSSWKTEVAFSSDENEDAGDSAFLNGMSTLAGGAVSESKGNSEPRDFLLQYKKHNETKFILLLL